MPFEEKTLKPQDNSQDKFLQMTTKPVPGLIISMAIPSIVSMVVSSIYNFADTYYVSKLSTSAAAGPGVAQPLFLIIQALSLALAVGAGSYSARSLGRQDKETASRTISTAFILSVAIGTVMGIFSIIFLTPLMKAFGATDTVLPYAVNYALYVILATPFFSATFVMSYAIRQEGNVRLAVTGQMTGAIVNIVLDPILIFVFKMGIVGAAVATSLSQIISFTILFQYIVRGKCVVRLKLAYFTLKKDLIWEIVRVGSPDLFRTFLASTAAILLNNACNPFGDAALASMTVCNKITGVIVSMLMGFGQGFMPMCGYNYGARLYNRVKEGFRFTMAVGLVAMGVLFALASIFAPSIMRAFQPNDPEFIRIGSMVLRAQMAALLPATVTIIGNMLFQACGKAWQSAVVALSRNGIMFIPLILTLPRLFQLNGVIWSQPTADMITFVVVLFMLAGVFRGLKKLEDEKANEVAVNAEA